MSRPLPESKTLYYRPSFVAGEFMHIKGYTADQLREHAAAVLADARDCRSCAHAYVFKPATEFSANETTHCDSDISCTNADRYEALPVVRLWRTTNA